MAMWMVANCKNGVSSWEIHRSLGVTQKTAWFMLHRIRLPRKGTTAHQLGGRTADLSKWTKPLSAESLRICTPHDAAR